MSDRFRPNANTRKKSFFAKAFKFIKRTPVSCLDFLIAKTIEGTIDISPICIWKHQLNLTQHKAFSRPVSSATLLLQFLLMVRDECWASHQIHLLPACATGMGLVHNLIYSKKGGTRKIHLPPNAKKTKPLCCELHTAQRLSLRAHSGAISPKAI